MFGSFGTEALLLLLPGLLLELYPVPLRSPFLSGRGDRQSLGLMRQAGRFRGKLCGLILSKLSGFGVGRGGAAVGKIVVLGVSQV